METEPIGVMTVYSGMFGGMGEPEKDKSATLSLGGGTSSLDNRLDTFHLFKRERPFRVGDNSVG